MHGHSKKICDETMLKFVKCHFCNKIFEHNKVLRRHIRRAHIKPFQCLFDGCHKTFGTNWDMRQHLRTHLKEMMSSSSSVINLQRKVCEYCPASFVDSSNFSKHLKACHYGLKPYVCNLCQKKFGRKDSLTKHYRIHMGDKEMRKSIQCEKCGAKYTTRSNLGRHVRKFHT